MVAVQGIANHIRLNSLLIAFISNKILCHLKKITSKFFKNVAWCSSWSVLLMTDVCHPWSPLIYVEVLYLFCWPHCRFVCIERSDDPYHISLQLQNMDYLRLMDYWHVWWVEFTSSDADYRSHVSGSSSSWGHFTGQIVILIEIRSGGKQYYHQTEY